MLLATVVVVLVLIQSGKEKSLSGTIAGAGESFFTKNKGKSKEKTLSIITTALSIIFVVLAVVFVIFVTTKSPSDKGGEKADAEVTESADAEGSETKESSEAEEESAAEEKEEASDSEEAAE